MYRVLYMTILFIFYIDKCTAQCGTTQCSKEEQTGLTFDPDKSCYDKNEGVDHTCTGTIFGPTNNVCNGTGDGEWRYSQPICTSIIVACSPPEAPENGLVIDRKESYGAFETAVFACNEGFQLEGPPSVICNLEQTWVPSSAPLCAVLPSAPTTPLMETSSPEEITSAPVVVEDPSTSYLGLIIGCSVGLVVMIFIVLMIAGLATRQTRKDEKRRQEEINSLPIPEAFSQPLKDENYEITRPVPGSSRPPLGQLSGVNSYVYEGRVNEGYTMSGETLF